IAVTASLAADWCAGSIGVGPMARWLAMALTVDSHGTLPSVADPDELIGLWDSAPYAYGSIESSTLALLSDGTGWATWESVAGARELVLLAWSRNGTDSFSLNGTTAH